VTLIVSGGIGIVQFFAVMPAIVYIDRLGKVNAFAVNLPVFIVLCYNKEGSLCYEVRYKSV
jgi:hypothetical protein